VACSTAIRKAVAGRRHALLDELVAGECAGGGAMHGIERPSLMLGWAGIGYALLRAALGDRVPSVLTLDDVQVR
jgi:hypothetical protein